MAWCLGSAIVGILTGTADGDLDGLRQQPGVDLAFSKGTDVTKMISELQQALWAKWESRHAERKTVAAGTAASGGILGVAKERLGSGDTVWDAMALELEAEFAQVSAAPPQLIGPRTE